MPKSIKKSVHASDFPKQCGKSIGKCDHDGKPCAYWARCEMTKGDACVRWVYWNAPKECGRANCDNCNTIENAGCFSCFRRDK